MSRTPFGGLPKKSEGQPSCLTFALLIWGRPCGGDLPGIAFKEGHPAGFFFRMPFPRPSPGFSREWF